MSQESHADSTTPSIPHAKPLTVIKVGGNELSTPAFVADLAAWIQALHQEQRLVLIVHGGGRSIERLQEELCVPIEKVKGIRKTSRAGMRAVQLSLLGESGPNLCLDLVRQGLPALTLAGAAGHKGPWLEAKALYELDGEALDLGFVGELTRVDPKPATDLLESGYIPIVAPVAADSAGTWLNVNADDAASVIAPALGARELFFLTNVPGLLLGGQPVTKISLDDIPSLRAHPDVRGGMLPKIAAAARALRSGVPTVGFGNLETCRSRTMTLLEP